jgi:hypothetical protein
MPVDAVKVAALINWLIAGAPPNRRFSDLVTEIGERLSATRLTVHQCGLYQAALRRRGDLVDTRHHLVRRIGGGAHDADLVAITGRFETGTATPSKARAFDPIPERDAASRPWRGSLVAAEPEHPLEAERADAVLLAGHEPHRHEPDTERLRVPSKRVPAVSEVRP